VPTAVVISYAQQSGKTVEAVEAIWEEAKKEADEKFKNRHDDHYWKWVNSVTKARCGIGEDKDSKK
jgi:hypothetical protein